MTRTASARPRTAALDRGVAMRLAATEYERLLELLRSLQPADWSTPTNCPGWDVRAMAAHTLGMAEMAASIREQFRQNRKASARAAATGETVLDALTGLQVDERADMTPRQIVDRLALRGPKAAAARCRAPGFVRRRAMPVAQDVGSEKEVWTFGYLIDVILTRDPWMHRADIAAATGADLHLTAEHDGTIVADVVAEWASRHGQAYRLVLTGPAGGRWSSGPDGPTLELGAVDFCRLLAGRGRPEGLLTTQVPF